MPHFGLSVSSISRAAAIAVLALGIPAHFSLVRAQTFSVLHSFTGGNDGASPYAGVTVDRGGNLYGTTFGGGAGLGTVFQLKLVHGQWILNPLYRFQQAVGANPKGRVIFGPDGALYGIASAGGTGGGAAPGDGGCNQGCGSVYKLQPPLTVCKSSSCPWMATMLYSFAGGNDGYDPEFVDPVFDRAGNLYGTTFSGGGDAGCGTAFELSPSRGAWTEKLIYVFTCDGIGFGVGNGLTFDAAGNLYGSASSGGDFADGTIFQLTPSGANWTGTLLYSFQQGNDGSEPAAPVLVDARGNLYGTTIGGGAHQDGTVFQLEPSGGNWQFSLIYGFSGGALFGGPLGNLIMDASGNFYGTTAKGGAFSSGSVFKLTRTPNGWNYASLHDFTGGNDGSQPYAGPSMDANGNLFGTTGAGGAFGQGVVWELTP